MVFNKQENDWSKLRAAEGHIPEFVLIEIFSIADLFRSPVIQTHNVFLYIIGQHTIIYSCPVLI